MKIQYSFTLLVLVTVIALIGVAEWTQSQKFSSEQREAFYTNLSEQSSTFEHVIKNRIDDLRSQLASTASRHTEDSKVLNTDSPFTAIAWLKKNPSGAATKYRAEWAESNSQIFDPSWFKGINFSQIKDGESLFVRKVDRYGVPFFALVMSAVTQGKPQDSNLPEQSTTEGPDDRVYLFAAVSSSTFNSWVDDYVGSSRNAFVFDEHANVIAHSQRQYSGTSLASDQFVNSSLRSGRSKVTQEFTDLEAEKRAGESLKVAQTNLRAAVSVPYSMMGKQKPTGDHTSQRTLMILFGVLLVGAAYALGGRFAKRAVAPVQSRKVLAKPPEVAVIPPPDEPELTLDDVQKKTQVNITEILARSAEIRKRLQLDFIELSVEPPPSEPIAEVKVAKQENNEEYNLPKVKIRRPKVSHSP